MTPEIDLQFGKLKTKYGKNALDRVEAMIYAKASERDPAQKGAKWVMPGLSTQPWLDVADYPPLSNLVATLEEKSAVIKREVNALLGEQSSAVVPYAHYLETRNDWKALYLFKDGGPVEGVSGVDTAKALLNGELKDWICPMLEMHFSVLEPSAVIDTHCDLWNFSINLHLAIDIPKECGIKVVNETRSWQEGRCLLFDYSYHHSAWNHSNQNRVCLLMDIWHPDLSEAERIALEILVVEIRKVF